jgi:myo-inositol-1(or 4)-monophosphatase
MAGVADVRRLGAAALDLAYVAAGRYDGFWEYGLHPWDVAAGLLLVREAGGYISEPLGEGNPLISGDVLAANDHLHGPLLAALRQA